MAHTVSVRSRGTVLSQSQAYDFFISLILNVWDLSKSGCRDSAKLAWNVERLAKNDRACAVAAAAAHDLNNELTVILSSVTNCILICEPGHPARPLLLDLQSAAQRCAWKASGLLNFSARRGTRPSPAPMESLLE